MVTNVIDAIKNALEEMEKEYCKLSELDYSKVYKHIRERAKSEKYLERPIAYEFYHQLRKLIEDGNVNFSGPIIQAEVDKRYQHCFREGKIPDFIIHIPNIRQNLAVVEFKLTSNLDNITNDFNKLLEFKENPFLRYKNVIEVIIGDRASLEEGKNKIKRLGKSSGKKITIIEFNTDSWNVVGIYCIQYKYP
jgi:hypothetical protein